MEYRAATLDDVPALVDLVESAYRGESSRAGWTTEADFLDGQRTDPEEIARLVGTPKNLVLMASTDRLVACCHLAEVDGAAYFGMFAVVPGLQGGGVGRAVLAEAERTFASWGLREVRMKVVSRREELIAWYVRRGYTLTDEFTPFPYGDARFGEPLEPGLRFVTLIKFLDGELPHPVG
ncbi:GNAT family N-acetyltransferase [Actinokineospora guangxiensis]|uniref:GNAT family N-acetyltransferase n=1 Tax=Actinokineospora guangxiensis TaxID=1490288 RepID=A0ABW0EUT7_9PSEU